MELDMVRVLLSVAIMAGVTYLLRMLPVTVFQKKIENRFIRSFLAYVPYAVLAAAVLLAYRGKSLLTVALGAVAVVFLAERLMGI